jgi:hypothetical protein
LPKLYALVAAQNLVAENKRILFRCVAMICEVCRKLLLLCEFGRIGCVHRKQNASGKKNKHKSDETL